MVFCGNRALSDPGRKYDDAFIRNLFLRNLQPDAVRNDPDKRRNDEKTEDPFSPVSASGRTVAGAFLRCQKKHTASLTVETAMVMSIVLLTLGAVIRAAYLLHDEVTGTMILEEVVVKTCYRMEKDEDISDFSRMGTEMGNPRLWLEDYRTDISIHGGKVSGIARAGDWSGQIERKEFRPELFLRRLEALKEMKNEQADAGDGFKEFKE